MVHDADGPSSKGRPPQPPPSVLCTTKRLPVRGSLPKKVSASPIAPLCAAGVIDFRAGAIAARIASITLGSAELQLAIGAGNFAIMKLPSGRITLRARNEPSFTASIGDVSA